MAIKVANNATSLLASSITNVATSMTVSTGEGAKFPTITGTDYFYVTLISSGGTIEIVKVTARSSDTFTIVRAQDNTSASAFSSGSYVELRPVAALFDAKMDYVAPGTSGNVLTSNGSVWTSSTPSSVTVATTAPSSPASGSQWYDTNYAEMNVYYSSQWVNVQSGLDGLYFNSLDSGNATTASFDPISIDAGGAA